VRRRVRELLEEFPDHPVLSQLEAVAGRALALPSLGPLKAALTGCELLLARAQVWEEGCPAAQSLAPLLSVVARLAQRWRAAELAAWPRALAACTRRAAQRADDTFYPLWRLLAGCPADGGERGAWLRGTAAALEEYLRAAPLGEFERRLSLLWAFSCGARRAEAEEDDEHLDWLLHNLHRYYAQFVPAVRAALAAAGAPIQAKLRDAVRLAKWEVRSVPPRDRDPGRPSFSVRPARKCAELVP